MNIFRSIVFAMTVLFLGFSNVEAGEPIPVAGPISSDYNSARAGEFCLAHPAECVDDSTVTGVRVSLDTLQEVAQRVMDTTDYEHDWKLFKNSRTGEPIPDYWAFPVRIKDKDGVTKFFGDCDDRALQIRHDLHVQFDIPYWQLTLAIIWDEMSQNDLVDVGDGRTYLSAHMAIVYYNPTTGQEYIIDILGNDQLAWAGTWQEYVSAGYIIDQVSDPTDMRKWLKVDRVHSNAEKQAMAR